MYTTADYLRLPPWEALIRMINHRYYLDLHPNTTTLVDFQPRDGSEVSVTLRAQRSGVHGNLLPAFSEETFVYRRLDLATFFQQNGPVVVDGLHLPTTTEAVLAVLAARHEVVFDRNDVVYETIDSLEQASPYRLRAQPHSLRWYGEVAVTLFPTPTLLGDQLTVTSLPQALPYPHGHVTGSQGALLLMPYNYSAARAQLLPLAPGNPYLSGPALASILNRHSPVTWRCVPHYDHYNLTTTVIDMEPRYTVLYNGPAVRAWTPRTDCQRVLVLALSSEYTFGVGGFLLVHYD